MKRYIVRLTEEERAELEGLFRGGRRSALTLTRANILLKADAAANGPAWTDARIADAFSCCTATAENVRRRLVTEGLEAALHRRRQKSPSRARKLDGRGEAHLVALACSEPPEGRSRWTLQLLADQLVELNIVDSICDQTVRRTLKKMNSNPTAVSTG